MLFINILLIQRKQYLRTNNTYEYDLQYLHTTDDHDSQEDDETDVKGKVRALLNVHLV